MNLQKIPATIVTGFLGSGKTTLLRKLLTNAQGLRIAVIVNEFGELGIDGELLRGCGIGCDENGVDNGQLFELANGCLCCTVQEEFAPVMEQLAARRDQIDYLVIETSGLALPKPLVQAFQWPALRNAITVDAVVTVVDAPAVAAGDFADDPVAVDAQRRADDNLDHDSPLHELFEDQLATADLVIVHKVDGMDAAALEAVETAVRAEAPAGVKLVRASHGDVPLDVLLGLQRAVEDAIDDRKTHHDEEEDHDHDAFESVSIALDVNNRQRLVDALVALVQRHEIYRVKGFVALPGTAMRLVVQGVGQRFDSYFDRAWRVDEPRASRLVLIGDHLDAASLQSELQAALA
jgi:cobalamin biosynthesis protein CobW